MTNQELASFCSKNAREADEVGDEVACQDWLDALVEFKTAAMSEHTVQVGVNTTLFVRGDGHHVTHDTARVVQALIQLAGAQRVLDRLA